MRPGTTTQPRCLTDAEVRELLAAARAHRNPRDHVWLRLLLCTGMRLSEAAALCVGDVRGPRGIREVIDLPRAKNRREGEDRVFVSETMRRHLAAYLDVKQRTELGGARLPDAWPLWATRLGRAGKRPRAVAGAGAWKAIGVRALEYIFARWQRRLRWTGRGAAPRYRTHDLRHTAIAAVLERTQNLEVARVFARHRSADVTKRYAHVRVDRIVDALPDWR